jgi:NADH dehydrogenase (ubiquinone) 1 alpha subcomplex subunit 12
LRSIDRSIGRLVAPRALLPPSDLPRPSPNAPFPGRQLKSRKGKLVGEDELGNKYNENMNYQSGRHRWVEYKNIENYDYSASSVPREWHGWLHHVDDEPGLSARTAPAYEVKFIPGGDTTGVPDKMYVPKGHFLNKRGIKNWKRYTPWSPP